MNEIVVFCVGIALCAVLGYVVLKYIILAKYVASEQELKTKIEILEEDLANERMKATETLIAYNTVKAQLHQADLQNIELKEKMAKRDEQYKVSFENIANRIVNDSSVQLQARHEEKLKDLLEPFKERMVSFEQRVEATHLSATKDNQSLKEQLHQLKELNSHIGAEARNLASALKGDKKIQGDWGEHRLERLLQAAGLQQEIHYRKQVNLKTDNGDNVRPDYIVYLPDDKNLIIDSKVSLVAYEKYHTTDSQVDALGYATEHLRAVKEHVTRLSSTNYSEMMGVNSPDYVLLFMPIDAALGLAMTEDSTLFEYALHKNIVLVSNHTLLATLKTVSFIWKQDLQNKNALEIAKQGGALYDKFVGFVDTMDAVGKRIDGAQKEYEQAMKQLHTGKGNLVRRTEQLRELGAKTQKQIAEKYKEDE